MLNLSQYLILYTQYSIWFLLTLLYSPVLYQLYTSRWEAIDYTHAYFILPVSLWLVWRGRASLKKLLTAQTKPSFASLGLAAFIFGVLMFIFGWRQDYLFVTALSLIPTLFGLTSYLYGINVAKVLSFPILYLLLLVPPPLGVLDSITLPMRYWISVITGHILQTLHYSVTRDGLLLSLGGHEIFMGAPCSGFRSLVTMFALGLVYSYISKGGWVKKAILVFSVIPFALLGNLIRVTSMCLVTFYFGDKIGQIYHDTSGYAVFVVLILCLIGLESLLNNSSRLSHKTQVTGHKH